MALADVDDLAAIFFGDHQTPSGAASAGQQSQCKCRDTPCDICDICDKQASARAGGPKEGLRHAATSCDTGTAGAAAVANVAGCRSGPNTRESKHWRGLSQLSQMSQGFKSQPAAAPTEPAPTTNPVPEFLALAAWSDADMARFTARRDRLIRWGYREADAEALAERLTLRDRSGDDRVNCTECKGYRPGRCGNHRAAGLHSPELGHDLAGMLQRCPGHHAMRG